MKIAIIGAGFSGAVIARELADSGRKVTVFESREHTAGNCYTYKDQKTGIMVHKYGPHIFHTDDESVWRYVNRFGRLLPFTNRVKAVTNGKVYSLPINLHTINQFFNKNLNPSEAKKFITSIADPSITTPLSFEDQALKFVGRELYLSFFKLYTKKQWGVDPTKLPSSILKRLPVRFNYNDNYYNSRFQGMPENGYTELVDNILNHENIEVKLKSKFQRDEASYYSHIFYSGTIDAWFNYSLGRLKYRTLDFIEEHHVGDYQGNPVINYCDESVPFTRITEHKHFSPWLKFDSTIIFKEFSRDAAGDDVPYYPLRLLDDKSLLKKYIELANLEKNVTFIGRLGTYRYLDMHVAIREALDVANIFLNLGENETMPNFTVNPLA